MATAMRHEERVIPLRKSGVNWHVLFAWLVYLAYKLTLQAAMVVIYVGVIADGLRRQHSIFGQKVYRVPLLESLRDFEVTYRLDYAMVVSIMMACLVCWAWSMMIEMYLDGMSSVTDRKRREYTGWIVLGTAVLVGDAILFYSSAAEAGWSGTSLSLSAGVSTIVYVAIVVLVNFIGVSLKSKTKRED